MTEWTSVFIEWIYPWLFFFFHKLYFLLAAQFKVSPLAMPSGCVVYVTLWTHTHTQTHTLSLNVGQLSMSAAEGLALELDFHISPHFTQSTLSCQVKVSTMMFSNTAASVTGSSFHTEMRWESEMRSVSCLIGGLLNHQTCNLTVI